MTAIDASLPKKERILIAAEDVFFAPRLHQSHA